MKIIFFGLGSIGQRHARLILENFKHSVFAYRSNKETKPNVLGVKEVYSWQEVKKISPDVAFITNPSFLHVKTAVKCAKLGMNLFIEKPLCSNTVGLDKLVKIVKDKKLTTYVAYCLRFHPVIECLYKYINDKKRMHSRVVVSSYLPNWRPQKPYRSSYSAYDSRGGGVIMDLSHEIDYSRYLFGDILKISGIFGKVSNLKVSAEDYADIIMKCRKGIVNMHLNFFSRNSERKITVDFPDSSYLKADLIENTLLIRKGKIKKMYKYNLEKDSIYVKQLKYFFENYNNPKMMNNLIEASKLSRMLVDFKNNNGKS